MILFVFFTLLDVVDSTGTTQALSDTGGVLDFSLVHLPGGGWAKHFYKERYTGFDGMPV